MTAWPSGRREALRKSRLALKDVEPEDFDGNFTMDVTNWLIAEDTFTWSPKLQKQLLDAMEEGFLGWILVPPEGFRL